MPDDARDTMPVLPPAPPSAPAPAPAALTSLGGLAFPILVLTLGHVLSNAVRTLPAIAADVLGHDLGVTPQGLASLTGAFNFSFALAQVPIGVALDRFGVRRVSLTLFWITTAGAAIATLAGGPAGFLLAQLVLGTGCAGMMICPITFAAKRLDATRFGLWSGLIQAFGNSGMLLSASPLAFLVETTGWRAGYGAATVFGLTALLLVALLVRDAPPPGPHASLARDAREVLRLTIARRLRGVMAIAFTSFAAVISVRGLWGGPWLMQGKGFPRIEAGNILLLATTALVFGPAFWGVVDRRFGHRRLILLGGHLLAAISLALVALGGPGGPFGALPPAWDAMTLLAFGLFISVQPLTFTLTRAVVPPEQVGKAMSAVNLSYFAGAAVLQAASGPVVLWAGIGAGLLFFAALLVVGTLLFLALDKRQA
ncbi:MFS transporter [Roseomonas chloroacetimidivorans]|jgi:MFS family permease|uniref:MFS transporter n=1 Tax=Roseomonas chloroacetimidivorans TaxID=1766656 RepID=UPI003C758896